jgi:hypothetical protein
MLESAATSFQIHLKVPPGLGARVYNASKILSAPMVAIAPTRPTSSAATYGTRPASRCSSRRSRWAGPLLQERVNFGFRYAERSILETFQANLDRYPVLMPQLMDEPPERLAHLRLHNGTIWRWNRPLIGFDEDGRPHLRIEHRVLPSGPTVPDCIANAALYFGALWGLIRGSGAAGARLPFLQARTGFYTAPGRAWAPRSNGWTAPSTRFGAILAEDLLPRARLGLAPGPGPGRSTTGSGSCRGGWPWAAPGPAGSGPGWSATART